MVHLQIKVKPGSKRSSLVRLEDGTWRAEVRAPPVDGKANEELIALVAAEFECSRGAVTIRAGGSGRMKLVRVEGVEGT